MYALLSFMDAYNRNCTEREKFIKMKLASVPTRRAQSIESLPREPKNLWN